MNTSSRLSSGLALSLLDLTVSFLCCLLHGSTLSLDNFTSQLAHFSLLTSTVDLLFVCFIRVAFYILPFAMHLAGRTENLKSLKQVVYYVSLTMYSISPLKLLLLTEPLQPDTHLPIGDYAFLVWNFLASIILDLSWRYYFSKLPSSYVVLEEENNEAISPKKSTLEAISHIFHYCKKEWLLNLSGFIWLFVSSATRVFVPYYIGQVIATVASTQSYPALHNAVYLMAVVSVVSSLAGGLRGGSFEFAQYRMLRTIRMDLFSALVGQEVAFFDSHKTGEIVSRLSADCLSLSDTVPTNVNMFLRNFVMMFGSLIFMLTLSWRLTIITLVLVPVIFLASNIYGNKYDYLSEKMQDSVANSNDVAEEVISTMRTVRSFACENFESHRYYSKLTKTLILAKNRAFVFTDFLMISEGLQYVLTLSVVWYGGHLVMQGKIKVDLLVAFLLYQMQLGENLREIGEVWTGLMQSVGTSRKVFEYIDRVPSIQHLGTAQPSALKGRIEFRNVHFSYPTRSNLPILKDLSFTVEPGETVALVGPSGSGKSSCIALLENFYQPIAGQVLVDGIPLDEYEHHYIHRKIALVGQEPVLFARSVIENIRYGVDDKNEQDCVNAAEMANTHNFIIDTTSKYETNVGEKGSQMSGGQKQRIAIARALVREPVILLLDEATSALDTESEHLVQEAIYKNLAGKTVILIAHRLSTVEKADKIIVINGGRVEQMGTHEQLLQQPGTYATLVHRQMMGDQKSPPKLAPVTSATVGPPSSALDIVGASSCDVSSHPILSSSVSRSLRLSCPLA